MAKYKVQSATMQFGATTYKVKSLPAGKHQESEPVEVTTLDDTHSTYLQGALVNVGDVSITIAGTTEPPTINTSAALTLALTISDGNSETSKEIDLGACILRTIEPAGIDPTTRELTYALTFTTGSAASAS